MILHCSQKRNTLSPANRGSAPLRAPMTILSRYLVRDFLKYLAYCVTALLGLVLLANLLSRLEAVFSSWEGFLDFADEVIRSIPAILEQLLPMAVLLATMFTFNALSRSSELLAMKTAGVGSSRMIRPILLVLIPIAALAYWNQNYLHRALHPGPGDQLAANAGGSQWRAWGDRVYYLRRVDPARNRLTDMRMYRWNEERFRLAEIGAFARGHRTDSHWVFEDGTVRRADNGGWVLEERSRWEVPVDEFPDVFRPVEVDARHLPLTELSREIHHLEKQGRRTGPFVLEWHQKLAALGGLFLMVLVGAPLSQFHFRRGKVSGEVVLSILAGVVFWLGNEIFFVLGKGEFLPPVVSAWGVNGAYLALGLTLIYRTR